MSLFPVHLSRFFIIFAVISFLLMGTFGFSNFGMTVKMDADGHMVMSDCFMPMMTTLCNMSPLEHIALWQNMFTVVSQQFSELALLVLFALFLLWRYAHARTFFIPKASPIRTFHRPRLRGIVFDPLKLAFARGTIHSKVF